MKIDKPRLLDFLKLQNNGYYKVSGLIQDDKKNSKFREKSFIYIKCVIDFCLMILCLSVLTCLFSLGNSIFLSIYNELYNNISQPDFILQTFLTKYLLYISITVILFILAPILMKIIRFIVGLRWLIVRFEKIGDDIIKKQKSTL